MNRTGAAILAAGKGTRMGTEIPKQYLELFGKPLFLYSIETYLPLVDDVVLVTGESGMDFCREVLSKYGLSDRVTVVLGGATRCDSSKAGVMALKERGRCDYVMIHDAARANIREDAIRRAMECMWEQGTAIAAVPSKDTIKIAGADGIVVDTPKRSMLYNVQTPQSFQIDLILEAFAALEESSFDKNLVTDDAMVVEQFTDHPVKLVLGDETNLKVTTKDDLKRMEGYLSTQK